ncbi:hypothetical protein FO514_33700, partial [Bacillus cereus]|nr:hypothetical protein [Bacillus cereus]
MTKGLLGGGLAIICMFLACWISSLMIDAAMNDLMRTMFINTNGMLDMTTINQSFIGIAPLILMYHLSGLEDSGSGTYIMSFIFHVPLLI